MYFQQNIPERWNTSVSLSEYTWKVEYQCIRIRIYLKSGLPVYLYQNIPEKWNTSVFPTDYTWYPHPPPSTIHFTSVEIVRCLRYFIYNSYDICIKVYPLQNTWQLRVLSIVVFRCTMVYRHYSFWKTMFPWKKELSGENAKNVTNKHTLQMNLQ